MCLLLTIAGCCGCAEKPVNFVPVIVDNTERRCPDVETRIEREFSRTTVRPAGPLSKGDIRLWVDRLEHSELYKNEVGRELIREFRICRRRVEKAPVS